MNNKVLVQVVVPEMDEKYDVYIPVNRKVGNVLSFLTKAIFELSNGKYKSASAPYLYNSISGERYPMNQLIRETDIRNGSKVILL